MFLAIVAISVLVTVTVWSHFGPVWGLITGFLLIGGSGWKLLLVIPSLLASRSPGGNTRREFFAAWEKRGGEVRVGHHETYPPAHLYPSWHTERQQTGESASDWLDRHGFLPHPEEGEVKIMSGWRYEIQGSTPDGREYTPATHGPPFIATRSFQYERGGAYGSNIGMTHVENCGHPHPDAEEAGACLDALKARPGPPTLALLGHSQPPSLGDESAPTG